MNYSSEKRIYMKINYFNADHTHALIDLPTNMCVEEAVKLFKGSSSHWINQNRLIRGKFAWGRGYGAFSVSQTLIGSPAILLIKENITVGGPSLKNMNCSSNVTVWNGVTKKTVKTVPEILRRNLITWLKPGVNGRSRKLTQDNDLRL